MVNVHSFCITILYYLTNFCVFIDFICAFTVLFTHKAILSLKYIKRGLNIMKLIIKKAVAAMISMTFISSAMTPSINDVILAKTPLIANAASSCVSFDEATGILTLSGNVVKEEVEERSNEYVEKVVCDEGTIFPADCSCMFSGYDASSIDLSNADTSNVTDMSYMFSEANLESLDLSSFDTSNVTDMSHMFSYANLKSLDLCSFDTSNVRDMSYMFYDFGFVYYDGYGHFEGPQSKVMIDLSSFDTSNVTNMEGMFDGCFTLKSLDLSNFDTSKVTNMHRMFANTNREYLDLSSFDTSNVTDMSGMFDYCKYLKSLDLSSFNTSNVTDMSNMFCLAENLESLNLSRFDTSNVTNMSGMFFGLNSLESLDLGNFDTSNVTNMSTMFGGLYSLESLDLSNFDTSNVTNMGGMFCSNSITSLDLSSFDTSKVSNMSFMFEDCKNLKFLDLSSFDTSNVSDMSYMFRWCSSLESLDLSSFDTSNVTDMIEMFCGSHSLVKIYVGSGWSTESVEKSDCMFDWCEKLKGGAGTVFDWEHDGIEYAHVDGGKDNPGYLTFKENDFFKTQNLILSGQIGVSFNLDLSSLTEQERNASYMEFKINGRTSIVPFDKNSKNASGKYYSFTCYVTSVEMADTITATFHYGNGSTVSKKYSVLDYINTIEKNAASFDNKTLYLIRSIADYGHYSQPFLAASNNWTIGSEHMEMSKHYTTSYSYDAIRNVTSKYQRVLDLGKSDIDKITYSLSLNSGTSLNVFIKAKDNYKGSVKVTTKKGNTVMSYTAVKQADGRYKVTIPDISAHQLGDKYTITAETTNGTATCSLSALSYVYAILDVSSDNAAKNAVSSLYIYYDATLNYRSKA